MSEQEVFQLLVNFFKALGNESRLKIIAMLAEGDCTVGELARRLHLKEPTVSEHLATLKDANLVAVRSEGNFRIYSFNIKTLLEMNKKLLKRDELAALVEDNDEHQVLKNYVDENERLTVIPASRKKLMVVLRWLTDKFEVGREYSEKEVNEIINRHHEDHATLRREMISFKLMKRDSRKGLYWR
jgi:predicted transcriptional regulator